MRGAYAYSQRGQPEHVLASSRSRGRKVRDFLRAALTHIIVKSQQSQVEKAGKLYDGKALPAARRVSTDMQDEHNFAGTLEVRAIADAKGKLAYDAYTYNGDSGTVFKAGTTTVVAEIVQGGMECQNEALGDALEAALEAKPKKPVAMKPAAKKKPPKKKPAAKRPAKRK